jgi:hypothetical protein
MNSERGSEYDQYELIEVNETEKEPTLFDNVKQFLKITITLVVLLGLVSFSGLFQAFQYFETSSTVTQRDVTMLLDAKALTVPITILVLRSNGSFGSERTLEEVELFFRNAAIIWQQANIDFNIVSVHEVEITDENIARLKQNPVSIAKDVSGYSSETINVFLVRSLGGTNGIAYPSHDITFVADFTTVIDFRTLAHEIGHLLSLEHVSGNRGKLMYRGSNGFELSLEEAIAARENALRF